MESVTLKTIAAVLLWSFLTGSKNLDFVWSYLGTLQILSHMALLKITIPMNVMIMSKALMSISVLDFKFSKYEMEITDLETKKTSIDVTKNIQNEITRMQFFELDYKEAVGFFANLRTTPIMLAIVGAAWLLAFVCWIL
mgnify:CR=1 FL=1